MTTGERIILLFLGGTVMAETTPTVSGFMFVFLICAIAMFWPSAKP